MSLEARLVVLLCACMTVGHCVKTTNINLCCPENQAHIKTEINTCTPVRGSAEKWEENVSQIKVKLGDLNSTVLQFPSNSDGPYKCSKPGVGLQPLDFLAPGIARR